MNISNILATKSKVVITIDPERTIFEAVKLMTVHNVGALIVLNTEGRVVGIISERDFVRLAAAGGELLSVKVADVMTRNVIVGVPEDEVMSVAHTMTEKRFRHIPVIDGDKLIGIISIGDILKAQRDQYRGQIDTLETQILAEED